MKPTELKLDRHDHYFIKRLYMKAWEERAVSGGVDLWTEIIMKFLEWKGYRLEKVDEV